MNFAEFLAYFPGDGSVVDDVEFAVLKEQKDFLFYGEGPSGPDMSSNFEKGKLTANVNGKISVGNINLPSYVDREGHLFI